MLFSYPAGALACNWLNSAATETIVGGINAIDAGGTPAAWPDCLPDDRRHILQQRTGLRPRIQAFWAAYKEIPEDAQVAVRNAIARQTDLPGVFSDKADCPSSQCLHQKILEPARSLARYLFDQLAAIKEGGKCIRDLQYDAIYLSGIRLCPFCGLNYFRAPGAPRHALDHFMPISRYPFSSADLRNLPPTCHECNSTFKGDADVLFNADGTRRRCSDPYLGPVFTVNLTGSEFFVGTDVGGWRLPRWDVSFVGMEQEQAETWDVVYHVKTRYYRDVLDADFLSWIDHFSKWYAYEFGKGTTSAQVADQLPRYIEGVVQDGFADRAFLKAETFRFVHNACSDQHLGDDVREWLWNFVEYST
jgi:hypothetical protein